MDLAEPQYFGHIATATPFGCRNTWCGKLNSERSKAQILFESREIHRRDRDRRVLPPSCPLFVKYNFQVFKGYFGVVVFKYLVPLLNGLHPPTPHSALFPKGKKENTKEGENELGWGVEDNVLPKCRISSHIFILLYFS